MARITNRRKVEICNEITTASGSHGLTSNAPQIWRAIVDLPEYDRERTDEIDPRYHMDRFALRDGTVIRYEVESDSWIYER